MKKNREQDKAESREPTAQASSDKTAHSSTGSESVEPQPNKEPQPDKDPQPNGQPRPDILQTFLQHQNSLRNYISRFMISKHEIEDVSQETFLRAYTAEQKTVIDQPKAFLFRIAKNMLLSELSKKSRKMIDYVDDYEQGNTEFGSDNLEDNLIAQQKLGAFCEAVATLPPKCRQVVLMKKVYGMSYKEIARRLGVSISAVEKHLIKGGKRCDIVLAERYPDLYPKAVLAVERAAAKSRAADNQTAETHEHKQEHEHPPQDTANVHRLPTANHRREL